MKTKLKPSGEDLRDLSAYVPGFRPVPSMRRPMPTLYPQPSRPTGYVGKHRGRLVLVPQLVRVGGGR